jgi:hypothetical protein
MSVTHYIGFDVHKKPYDRSSWVTPADENGSDGWLSIEGGLGRAAGSFNGASPAQETGQAGVKNPRVEQSSRGRRYP